MGTLGHWLCQERKRSLHLTELRHGSPGPWLSVLSSVQRWLEEEHLTLMLCLSREERREQFLRSHNAPAREQRACKPGSASPGARLTPHPLQHTHRPTPYTAVLSNQAAAGLMWLCKYTIKLVKRK